VTTRRDDRGPVGRGTVASLLARLDQRETFRRMAVVRAGRPAPARPGQRTGLRPAPVPGCDPRVFDLFRDAAARGGRAA
jgi:hypothetical protein